MGFTPVTKAAGTAGNAEGSTPLNAFDNALLAAGIGNINLVRISSILPPGVRDSCPLPQIKPGRHRPDGVLGPDQRGARRGDRGGGRAGRVPRIQTRTGSSWSSTTRRRGKKPRRMIVQMLEEAFRVRGEPIRDMQVFAVEHRVERTGCALAAVTLLAHDDLV